MLHNSHLDEGYGAFLLEKYNNIDNQVLEASRSLSC